jgi:hypothetical protein
VRHLRSFISDGDPKVAAGRGKKAGSTPAAFLRMYR